MPVHLCATYNSAILPSHWNSLIGGFLREGIYNSIYHIACGG